MTPAVIVAKLFSNKFERNIDAPHLFHIRAFLRCVGYITQKADKYKSFFQRYQAQFAINP